MTSKIKISDLVCQIMRQNHIRKCNQGISRRIRDSLIKVASTRIFAEPEQSFMELPVNSIDSYNALLGKPSTGKFGMGFFSMLYWLAEDPLRTFSIVSKYGDRDIYKIILNWKPEGLTLTNVNLEEYEDIRALNPKHRVNTGTKIHLDCTRGELSKQNIDNIFKYIDRLSTVEGINIYYNDDKITEGSGDKNIEMRCNERGFIVVDNAQGISYDTLIDDLLIPSSSSKKGCFH